VEPYTRTIKQPSVSTSSSHLLNIRSLTGLFVPGKKNGRITGIPKLEDANDAGGKNALSCTLILTEGARPPLIPCLPASS